FHVNTTYGRPDARARCADWTSVPGMKVLSLMNMLNQPEGPNQGLGPYCPRWESNPHAPYGASDFKSEASAFPPRGLISLHRSGAAELFHAGIRAPPPGR